jgi:RNA polymerase sigma-70 factor (ECF subfamily)
MPQPEPDTEQLLQDVSQGDVAARSRLLERNRPRLRQMIAVRFDRRLAARIDPSDVVQEVLMEADRQLPDYLRRRPLPFYPWLRQIASDRLAELYRHHVRAHRRSVTREEAAIPHLPEESAWELIDRLFARGSTPSEGAARQETRRRVRDAMAGLPERDREVLVLRHLERLSTAEIAAVMGVSEGAVYTRHLRALRRLSQLLGGPASEDKS